jgi:hypothetical protein
MHAHNNKNTKEEKSGYIRRWNKKRNGQTYPTRILIHRIGYDGPFFFFFFFFFLALGFYSAGHYLVLFRALIFFFFSFDFYSAAFFNWFFFEHFFLTLAPC